MAYTDVTFFWAFLPMQTKSMEKLVARQQSGNVMCAHTLPVQHFCVTVCRILYWEQFVTMPRHTRLKWKYNWNHTQLFSEQFDTTVEKYRFLYFSIGV